MNTLRCLTRIALLTAITTGAAGNAVAQSTEAEGPSLRHSILIENVADYPHLEFVLVTRTDADVHGEQPVTENVFSGFPAGQSAQLQARLTLTTVSTGDEGRSLVVAESGVPLGQPAELSFRDPTREIRSVYRISHVACGEIGLELVATTYIDFEGSLLPQSTFLREQYHSMLAGDGQLVPGHV